MATANKDFKIKNGLQVAGNSIFSGTVAVATPTLSGHAATKGYVDSLLGGGGAVVTVSSAEPQSPSIGTLWFDTDTNHLNIFAEGQWYTLALYNEIPDHTHDTSIGGDGRILDIYVDGGTPYTIAYITVADGGTPSTIDWNSAYNGGIL